MTKPQKQDQASAIIAECMRRKDAGEIVNPEKVLADHPESADELREYFDAERRLGIALGTPDSGNRPLAKRATVGPGAGDSVPAGGVSFEELPFEFGRYRVQKVLGQGAMGAVYLAHDTKLARDVALKTPKLDVFADGEMVERFEREARSAATLHHRNICPVFDVGEINGIRFLTMAYIEGKPLSAFVSEDKPMSRKQAATVIRKLALGLQEAHVQGVVHRDLKPANVMIDKAKEPVVMDFGLAHQTEAADKSRLTGVGVLMGSPAYMSPEQVSGEPDAVGHATDIYSLGVMLFELLTGRLPFEGGVAAIIGQILTSDPPDVRTLRSAIDEDLAQICLRMMAKSTEDRFATMKEVADALGDYLRNIKKRTTTSTGARSIVAPDLVFDDAAVSAVSVSAAKPKTRARRKKSNRNTKSLARWIGGGLLGLIVLAGVIIKLSDGTSVEIPDGKTVTLETNDDGSLKSLAVLPTKEDRIQTPSESSSPSTGGDISQDGFVDLFNGRDLTGWSGLAGVWKWEDGELIGTGNINGKPLRTNTALCSDRSYTDFELQFEVKLEGDLTAGKAPNSGIQFRSTILDRTTYKVAGPQADIGDNWWGGLYGEATTGVMHKPDEDVVRLAVRADDWNQYRLRVHGDKVSIRINNMETVNRSFGDLPEDGLLGFQIHGGRVMTARFRNIRIREDLGQSQLGSAPEEAFVGLFNGQNLDGWRVEGGQGWAVENGEIVGRAQRSRLVTVDEDYGDCEIRVECRLGAGANSGIYVRNRFGEGHFTGFEAQLSNEPRQKTMTGGIYGHTVVSEQLIPDEQWFELRFLLEGRQLKVFVNDTKTSETIVPAGGATQGAISLQSMNGGPVRFRKVEVRRLNETTTAVQGDVSQLAVSPNGNHVAVTGTDSPGRFTIWDTTNSRKVAQIDDPSRPGLPTAHLSYSPDGNSLLYCTGDHVRVVSASDGTEQATFDFPAPPKLAVFPKRTLALATYYEREAKRTELPNVPQRVRIWNWKTQQVLHDGPTPIPMVRFPTVSPDERYVTLDQQHHHVRYTLKIDGDDVALTTPTNFEQTSRVRGPLVFSPDGRYAATSVKSNECMAAVLDVQTGRVISQLDPATAQTDGHDYGCNLGFSPDGTQIVMADHTGRVALWDVATGNLISELEQFQGAGFHSVPGVVVSPNGVAILGGGPADKRFTVKRLETAGLPAALEPSSPEIMSGEQNIDLHDWTELFNGRDLTGWQQYRKGWSVKDGVLIGGGREWIMSNTEYLDFDLELEYFLPKGGNSGVFLRAWADGKSSGADFHEIQLLDDTDPQYSTIPDTQRTGALWNQIAAEPVLRPAPNQWHRMRVVADGEQLRVWINGTKVVDGQLPPGKPLRGRIGLQAHQTHVEFRNIRIRELRTPVNTVINASTDALMLDTFPEGKWIPLLETEAQLEGWSTVNGLPTVHQGTVSLQAKKKPGHHLWGKRMERAVILDSSQFVFHVRHNKLSGFGMLEGMRFGDSGFGVANFGPNSYELWMKKKEATHGSKAGIGNFADLDCVVMNGKWTAYINGQEMFSRPAPKESLTGVNLSVRAAHAQWREVAIMRLSDAQVAAIRRGELPSYPDDG